MNTVGKRGTCDTLTPMNAVPDWLTPRSSDEIDIDPDDPDGERISAKTTREILREIEYRRYESVLERFLDDVAQGQPLSAVVRDYPLEIEPAKMLRWIHRDPERKDRYYEAQAIGAEVIACQMIEIADAKDSMEDVARSTLRVGTRKWLLGVFNRKRFGDVKQIEQNVNVSLSEAMSDAQQRIEAARTVDVPVRLIENGGER